LLPWCFGYPGKLYRTSYTQSASSHYNVYRQTQSLHHVSKTQSLHHVSKTQSLHYVWKTQSLHHVSKTQSLRHVSNTQTLQWWVKNTTITMHIKHNHYNLCRKNTNITMCMKKSLNNNLYFRCICRFSSFCCSLIVLYIMHLLYSTNHISFVYVNSSQNTRSVNLGYLLCRKALLDILCIDLWNRYVPSDVPYLFFLAWFIFVLYDYWMAKWFWGGNTFSVTIFDIVSYLICAYVKLCE